MIKPMRIKIKFLKSRLLYIIEHRYAVHYAITYKCSRVMAVDSHEVRTGNSDMRTV